MASIQSCGQWLISGLEVDNTRAVAHSIRFETRVVVRVHAVSLCAQPVHIYMPVLQA